MHGVERFEKMFEPVDAVHLCFVCADDDTDFASVRSTRLRGFIVARDHVSSRLRDARRRWLGSKVSEHFERPDAPICFSWLPRRSYAQLRAKRPSQMLALAGRAGHALTVFFVELGKAVDVVHERPSRTA